MKRPNIWLIGVSQRKPENSLPLKDVSLQIEKTCHQVPKAINEKKIIIIKGIKRRPSREKRGAHTKDQEK